MISVLLLLLTVSVADKISKVADLEEKLLFSYEEAAFVDDHIAKMSRRDLFWDSCCSISIGPINVSTNDVLDVFEDVAEYTIDLGEDMVEWGEGAIEDVVEWTEDAVDAAVGWVEDAWEDVGEFLEDVAEITMDILEAIPVADIVDWVVSVFEGCLGQNCMTDFIIDGCMPSNSHCAIVYGHNCLSIEKEIGQNLEREWEKSNECKRQVKRDRSGNSMSQSCRDSKLVTWDTGYIVTAGAWARLYTGVLVSLHLDSTPAIEILINPPRIELDAKVEIELEANISAEKKIKVNMGKSKPVFRRVFMAGPVPVLIVIGLQPVANIVMKATGQATGTISYTFDGDLVFPQQLYLSFRLDNFEASQNFDDLPNNPPTIDIEEQYALNMEGNVDLEIQVRAAIEIQVQLYNVFEMNLVPEFVGKLYVHGQASLSNTGSIQGLSGFGDVMEAFEADASAGGRIAVCGGFDAYFDVVYHGRRTRGTKGSRSGRRQLMDEQTCFFDSCINPPEPEIELSEAKEIALHDGRRDMGTIYINVAEVLTSVCNEAVEAGGEGNCFLTSLVADLAKILDVCNLVGAIIAAVGIPDIPFPDLPELLDIPFLPIETPEVVLFRFGNLNSGSESPGSTPNENSNVNPEFRCGVTVHGSNVGAANNFGNSAGDVVYEFVATAEHYEFDACKSRYDSYLRVYDTSNNQIAANDDHGGNCVSANHHYASHLVVTNLNRGQTYKLVVEGYSSSTGDHTVTVRCPSGANSISLMCQSHLQCLRGQFCAASGTCKRCRECKTCGDGVDGSCGMCGSDFPLNHDYCQLGHDKCWDHHSCAAGHFCDKEGNCKECSNCITCEDGLHKNCYTCSSQWYPTSLVGTDRAAKDCPNTQQIEGMCRKHSDCSGSEPFCYNGLCAPCSECHYCHDGVDNTCGNSCGGPTHTNEVCVQLSDPNGVNGGHMGGDICGDTMQGSTHGRAHNYGSSSGEVIVEFTATTNDMTFDACQSDYDSYLRIYDAGLNHQITANDDHGGRCSSSNVYASHLHTTSLQPGVTYNLLIEGYSSNHGNYRVDVTCAGNDVATGTWCDSHTDCGGSNPFCYHPHGCWPCSECHNCWDGVDNTCGPYCPGILSCAESEVGEAIVKQGESIKSKLKAKKRAAHKAQTARQAETKLGTFIGSASKGKQEEQVAKQQEKVAESGLTFSIADGVEISSDSVVVKGFALFGFGTTLFAFAAFMRKKCFDKTYTAIKEDAEI